MDKAALKTFATSARKELLSKVLTRALKFGITEETIMSSELESSDAFFIGGRQLSIKEKSIRDLLIKRIHQQGFHQVMEEVAYTWFNRLTALRFMEVNDYLPTGIRVLSSSNPESIEPDMLNKALELDLEVELDKEYIYELKLNNNSEELFKYLIIKHCNEMNRYFPFMFSMNDDYTELLFPDGLLAMDSFIRKMTDPQFIPEDNWRKVEVIGWLYQYYISDEKKRIFDSETKRGKEEIPPATQLFTPEWIVRYMVQNSLGRYWVEAHPEHDELKRAWEFYLENLNFEEDFQDKLKPYINKELNVEDIKCFDPAMGSGHILVYMFDVLYEIYRKCGYMEQMIPKLILENNLYGLDIDDRAYQLACFSVIMKALEYNDRFLRTIEREGLNLNLASIQETNEFIEEEIAYIAGASDGETYELVKTFLGQFQNAKLFGSLIEVTIFDRAFLSQRLEQIQLAPVDDLFEEQLRNKVLRELPQILKQVEIMSQTFDILVTNPPYIGNRDMVEELKGFIRAHYAKSKEDLFAAFIEYSLRKVIPAGHIGVMCPFVWMFISSYKELRKEIISTKSISSLVQLEYSAFTEATVPICTFTLRNNPIDLPGEFIRLTNFPGASTQPVKLQQAIDNPTVGYRYQTKTKEFDRIDGSPLAYWISEKTKSIFENSELLESIAEPKVGLQTGNNDQFLRLWYEVDFHKIGFGFNSREEAKSSKQTWFPYNKGGSFRKWYGNNEWIINWEDDGALVQQNYNEKGKPRFAIRNKQYYFKEGITWSDVSSSYFGVRYSEKGFIFDVKGSSMFPKEGYKIEFLLAVLASKIVKEFLAILNPTISFQVGDIKRLPIVLPTQEQEQTIVKLSKENIEICKDDWDSFETSWNFKKHPLLAFKDDSGLIERAFVNWKTYKDKQFKMLKANEERLNEILIEMYGLTNELTSEVDDSAISISRASVEREIKSLISYGIGCIFGRYSLDADGLAYAGGDFNEEIYKTFKPVKNNIIPIVSESYFEEDMVNLFIKFIKVAFGDEQAVANLNYISDSLGRRANESYKETLKRYFLNDFYKDHLNIYKSTNKRNKAPIYFLFTTGDRSAFNCLIYLHRYDESTLSRIRNDYLHEYQLRLEAETKDLQTIIHGDYSPKEITNAKKELARVERTIDELKTYDELLHHMADQQISIHLDNGVTFNHQLFKGLVAKIK